MNPSTYPAIAATPANTVKPAAAASPAIEPISDREIELIDAYWRACNYLCAGMIYLRDNPLLREPLSPDHIKQRLLGHWGSDPGQSSFGSISTA